MFTSKVTIRKGKSFELISYGNGAAYELRRDDSESIFLQGDDAEAFRQELEDLERLMLRQPVDLVLKSMWEMYC